MLLRNLFALIVALMISVNVTATPLLDVYLPDRISYKEFILGGFDVLEMDKLHAEIVGWPQDINRLEALGLTYTVIDENIEATNRSHFSDELDDMGGFPTFDEIGEWVDSFVVNNSDIVSGPDTIGYSIEDRPIWAIKISDNPEDDEDETEVFINATIHAREAIVPMIAMNTAEMLAQNYGIDQRITDIVDNTEIWILPVVNPDGYTYNEEIEPDGGGMWRKNKRRYNDLLYGVDLNRNFDFHWGYDDRGSSPEWNAATYRGDSPASEPETQVMQNFVNSRNFAAVANYHSHGDMILVPYSYDLREFPVFYEIYMEYASLMNETLGWDYGRGPLVLNYPVNGDATDWMEGAAGNDIFAFTFEVGNWGEGGFWPYEQYVDEQIEEQEEPMLVFLELAADPYILGFPKSPEVVVMDSLDNGTWSQVDTVAGDYRLDWTVAEDTLGNIPVAYDIRRLSEPQTEDGGDGLYIPWEMDGFELSSSHYVSFPYSYFSGSASNLNQSLEADHPLYVVEGAVLTFMTMYDIEADYDYAYVQASTDGTRYVNLEGSITTNDDPNEVNLGNGITGSSDGWIEAQFPLDEFHGQHIYLQFKYITDQYENLAGFYVDDISPILGFIENEIIAESVVETSFMLNEGEIEDTLEYWYEVRSIDAEDQYSKWSNPAGAVVVPEVDENDANVTISLPDDFVINKPYPNPFNATTNISFYLPTERSITISATNVIGREVFRSDYRKLSQGWHVLPVNGDGWASGIYFIRASSPGDSGSEINSIQKVILLK